MGELVLRPLRVDDEEVALAAHGELAGDGFSFLLEYEVAPDFPTYVDLVERRRRGLDLPAGWVPTTLLVAEVDGTLVGRTAIRHELTSRLQREGGHVGYGVRPGFRRRGYATAILRRSLARLADRAIDPALVTCDDDNIGSARTIERCGGILEDRVDVDGRSVRRYRVPTTGATAGVTR